MANARLCAIPDCGKPVRTRGHCLAHYKRLLKYGDALAGGTAKGAPMALLNKAVEAGSEDCLFWPFATNNEGAAQIRVAGKTTLVTRIVCGRVHGPPPTPKHQAAHSCGKGHLGCVSGNHLSWKTQSENEADKLGHGTAWKDRKHHWSKLTPEQVMEARVMYASGQNQTAIGKKFGVSQGAISRIITRENRPHLEGSPFC